MSYTESHLLPGETIKYRGKLHWYPFQQGLIGRLLDYGTILVVGTGGTQDSFKNISNPLEFRRQVQAEASELDSEDRDELRDSRPRDERECPFCAEMILKKARVCKHCGRDVEPLIANPT